jgi:murein DD-endopeptidase MepM/ murein hydrolase activator NlpD
MRRPTPRNSVVALVVASLLAALVATSVAMLPAAAADLEDRRDRVTREIDRGQSHLDQSSARLVAASSALQSARASLAAARVRLARTRGELAAAQAFDEQMQDELETAVRELRRARKELVRGRARVAEQQDLLARIVVANYESGDPALLALSTVFNSQDTAQLTSRLESARSVLDKEAAGLSRLEAARVLLTMQEQEFQEAEREVARRRAAAAENLERKARLERLAESARASISGLVVARSRARDAAADARGRDLRELKELESERQRISAMLERRAEAARKRAEAAARARARAEARAAREAARRAARESARQEAAREKAARARREREGSRSRPHPQPPAPVTPPPPPAPSAQLLLPVDGYVSSSYGMRFHPVYKRWSLHDGTDFGASCGTPIRAAASGTVIATYYNSAYGNRVIMDHGYRQGVGLGTSYNHLSAYSTYPGQRVERGDVIGYVGTTGASTGCHLHFMVFENGRTVNPMSWL